MAYTDIDDPSAHFTTVLYTGTSDDSVKTVTNDANAGDFKPDWLWIKGRSGSYAARNHFLYDSNRGETKYLESNTTDGEATSANNTFNTNGFSLTSDYGINGLNTNHVAWQWKANGGSTTTNDASATGIGTHDSIYQANTEAGFSIVTWTGNAEPETLAHGLGGTPEMIIIKNRTDAEGWWVGATPAGAMSDGKWLDFSTAAVATNSTSFVNQNPTSTVFRVGGSNSAADGRINGNGKNMLAYLFRSIQGYSKINSYIGNGSTNGVFVYTGFKPAYIMIKYISATLTNWEIRDNKRSPFNDANGRRLFADTSGSVSVNTEAIDLLSNGFKIRSAGAGHNTSGGTHIYYAVAESPFCSSKGVPTTAR